MQWTPTRAHARELLLPPCPVGGGGGAKTMRAQKPQRARLGEGGGGHHFHSQKQRWSTARRGLWGALPGP